MSFKSNDENNDLISCETQTQNSDSDPQIDRDNEDITGITFPSLLRPNCTFPTELFYTLSPISVSQITSESTPITTNRREPIGGEDLIQQALQTPLLTRYTVRSSDSNSEETVQIPGPSRLITDRPPLIGRTNSSSDSSHSTLVSNRQSTDHSVKRFERSDPERDPLANRVRQLLGKTKRESTDEEVESLGLIYTINDSFDEIESQVTIESERSEPDGKGRPYLRSQRLQRIVYYSSSESEGEEMGTQEAEGDEVTKQPEGLISKTSQNKFGNNYHSIRSRSYSASGRTVPKHSGIDISSILRQSLKPKDFLNRETTETQTNRSFLAEQAVSQHLTRDKRPIDTSKAIQTSTSLLSIELYDKKEVKDSECQTSKQDSLDVSSFLRHLLKRHQKSTKVSVGTQTIRSYLTEQALKRKKEIETKRQNRDKSELKLQTKAIQTSYTSSVNSESESTIIDEKSRTYNHWTNDKQPISWFIPIDKKSQNRNISRISKTFTRKSGHQTKVKQSISGSSSPTPLQEAFNRHCIEMKTNSQIRVNRINTIAELRKRTADERLIEMAKQFFRQQEAQKVIRTKVIQPVFKSTIKRFFTHEEMRAQTEKIYNTLPEVKAKKELIKQKERVKNQRLLAQIYKYKLKDNALKGRLTWKITQSCLN